MAANTKTPAQAQAEGVAAVEAAATASIRSAKVELWESPSRPGLKFKLRTVSRYAIIEARKKIVEPEVPVVFIEDKSRSEANPNHPKYIEAMRDYNLAVSVATVDTYIALGTALATDDNEWPNDLDRPEGDDWVDQLEAASITVPPREKKYARYLAWVKYYALNGDDEISGLIRAAQRFNGLILEEDVAEALDGLKSDEERDTDTQAAAAS